MEVEQNFRDLRLAYSKNVFYFIMKLNEIESK